jgi:D-sedoheptulose 7-phosphate isomerase
MEPSQSQSEERWLTAYVERYRRALLQREVITQLIHLKEMVCATQAAGKKVILAGNGGSAAIASHVAVDFTKNARIRCVNFNEADLITCFANDYGYEHWVEQALEFYADPGDLVVLISSSGQSRNMVNAARYTVERGLTLVTFTGFAKNNPLQQWGHLNFWVDSRAYNVIEMTHQMWLLAVCDLIVSANEPQATPAGADTRERGMVL